MQALVNKMNDYKSASRYIIKTLKGYGVDYVKLPRYIKLLFELIYYRGRRDAAKEFRKMAEDILKESKR
jgi:hypothetical protein